jgi:DNA mismatch endonuclease (patch repair protein)
MDIFSPDKRSEIMAKVQHKNSRAELTVFSYLRKNKIYFQAHYRKAPGNPDIALPRKKKAVFIDGDFWHGRTIERIRARRGPNDFWTKKMERNVERDKEQTALLLENGWQILRVWESDITRKATREEVFIRIRNFLQAP